MRCGKLFVFLSCFFLFSVFPARAQSSPQTTFGQTQNSSQGSGKQSQNSQDLSNSLEASWETFDNLLNEQEKSILTLELGLESTEKLRLGLSQNCADLRNYADELSAQMFKRDRALMEAQMNLDREEAKSSRRLRLLLLTWGIIAAYVVPKAIVWYIKKKAAVI